MTNASTDTNQSLEGPLNDRFYTSLILDKKKPKPGGRNKEANIINIQKNKSWIQSSAKTRVNL